MSLDVLGRTRLRSTRDESLRVGGEGGNGVADRLTDVADEQREAGQQAAHVGEGIGSVAHARTLGQVGLFGGGRAKQRGDVVSQDFGRHVDQQGLLRQARDGFEFEAVLEPFEGLLDAPALAADRLSRQGRTAGINTEASAATTRRPHQRGTRPA